MCPYEVQTFTLCDGWTNTWTFTDKDGKEHSESFDTEEAAIAALAEFLAEIQEEIFLGQREPDEGYSLHDFRIVKTSTPKPGVLFYG